MGASAIRILARHGEPGFHSALHGLSRRACALALGALVLLGWAQLSAFRDPFVHWTEDAALLLQSSWGTRWMAAVAAAAAALAAAAFRPLRPALLPLTLALAAYPALSGHAAGVEPWTAAAVVSDWLHVLAAGTWMGALGVLLLSGRGSVPAAAPLVLNLQRFSLLARASVAVLVVTGGAASWLHLPGVSALWDHPYGRILAVKIVLVVALMGLGAWNWRVLSPDVHTDRGAARLLRASRAEVALGVLVLGLTAWLTGTAPPS